MGRVFCKSRLILSRTNGPIVDILYLGWLACVGWSDDLDLIQTAVLLILYQGLPREDTALLGLLLTNL